MLITVLLTFSVILASLDASYVPLYHRLGEWSGAEHGHSPVLVSATVYIGNITYHKCPKILVKT